MVVSGGGCSRYLATVAFVEEVDNLFSIFNGGTCVDSAKTLCCPLCDNSPHIGNWTKGSMAVNSCTLNDSNGSKYLLVRGRKFCFE
jgi:hypothetical protein